jgi:hypothetical protein
MTDVRIVSVNGCGCGYGGGGGGGDMMMMVMMMMMMMMQSTFSNSYTLWLLPSRSPASTINTFATFLLSLVCFFFCQT